MCETGRVNKPLRSHTENDRCFGSPVIGVAMSNGFTEYKMIGFGKHGDLDINVNTKSCYGGVCIVFNQTSLLSVGRR